MNWEHAIAQIEPHVVRIETPSGWGTGFLAFYNMAGDWCGIATAAHVVAHADEWQQPIRIRHASSSTPRFLKPEDRVVFVDQPTDSAVLLFLKGDLQLPEVPIGFTPVGQSCSVGADVGWVGYPNIEPDTLCFFSGAVSARKGDSRAYLIDGVAINGVSGGPVFHCPDSENVQIIGSISAYHANRATGETLPGLLRAQDVSHFAEVANRIQSIDQGRLEKQEFEEAQRTKASGEDGAVPEIDPPPVGATGTPG